MKVLLVISHTEHYLDENGTLVGWSSTVKELDELTKIFSKVIHLACLYKTTAPPGMTSYQSDRVEFMPVPPFGGKGVAKASVLYTAPYIIYKVFAGLRKASHFQFRAPTSMGVYLIPLLSIFSLKKGWFKYAGNWAQQNPPLSYWIQRSWLKRCQTRVVTINGSWPNQPDHCLSYENPCLFEEEFEANQEIISKKSYEERFKICFVGRLEKSKGIDILMQALLCLDKHDLISDVFIIGDGSLRDQLAEQAQELTKISVRFYGYLQRNKLLKILSASHFIVLPTMSEGFPKVVAEGWSLGCIPMVTNVSSIGQYVINNKNGFIFEIENRTAEHLVNLIKLAASNKNLLAMAQEGFNQSKVFTYERYLDRINNNILMGNLNV